MKTNILYVFIAAMMALSACSEDLVKDDIDAANGGDASKLPVVTVAAPGNITYESASVSASWSNAGDEVVEAGFVYSLNESFSPMSVLTVDEISDANIRATLSLASETKYYIKAYAQTKNNGVAYSDVVSLTTAVAPVFEDTYLFGKYDAIDVDIYTGEQEGDVYEITIAQRGSSYNRVNISNIWGGERTIEGIVDFEKKTISIASTEVIYIHSSYGNTFMLGLVIEGGEVKDEYADVEIATYDDEGNITFEPWAAHVSAGDFGHYTTILEKK
jgi:hypothetical protein